MTYIPEQGLDGDPWINHAIRVIKEDYGVDVSLDSKDKNLLKFGRSEQIQTTKSTIMTLPTGIYNEAYLSSNLINTMSSSSAADTHDIILEGHTVDGSGDFTFVKQTLTGNGQNQVAFTPLARVSRAYNANGTDLVGTHYFYETDTDTAGVPDTGIKVHMMIAAGKNNSEKSSTTLDQDTFWIVTAFHGTVLEKSDITGNFHIEFREKGSVFRELVDDGANGKGYSAHADFAPYLIIPANSDVRLRADSSLANKEFSGWINGVLAGII